MQTYVHKSIEILSRTPVVLSAILEDLCDELAKTPEDMDKWSAFEVLAHLIQMDRLNWIKRIEVALSRKPVKTFEPFDRKRQFDFAIGKSVNDLLEEFVKVRSEILSKLQGLDLNNEQMHQEKGYHPEYGEVTIREIVSTWAAHDLTHIHQITRILARVYKDTVVLALLD